MRLKWWQYLCRHDFQHIGKHKYVSENLWKCSKCGVYYVQHWGIGIGFKCKRIPDSDKWNYRIIT